MLIRVGYELHYECADPTPMVLLLHVHHSRAADIIQPDHLIANPSVPLTGHHDAFGNWCTRLTAPAGQIQLSASALVRDSGLVEDTPSAACQHPIEELPPDVLPFLLGSRYCEADRLATTAWELFGHGPTGAERVQAICDFVHRHITFGYEFARSTRTASDALREGKGVCRDYAHLAVAFCRSLNIPARYCTGYLGDIGMPPPYASMDFAAWFEAFIGGRWHVFDPRNNSPRVGRILIARGRDAADVAFSNTFGLTTLSHFRVVAEEVSDFNGAL